MKAGVKTARIVSETQPEPSKYTDKDGNPKNQDVAKIQFAGQPEAVKLSLNWPTLRALVNKFGKDSKAWMGHDLGLHFEKYKDAQGVTRVKLYLVPEGYVVMDDSEGKTVVVPEGTTFDEPAFESEPGEDGDPGPQEQ